MEINGINLYANNSAASNASNRAKENASESQAVKSEKAENVSRKDTFVKSTDSGDKAVYSKENVLEQIRASEEQRVQAFSQLLQKMVAKQGESSNLTILGLNINVTEEERIDAERSISDGGEYSVDAVATRIMDMAKALAGDDTSKISTLRDAVIQGFKGAAEQLGIDDDDMPDITKQTYDEVMARFDEWENPGSTDTEKE